MIDVLGLTLEAALARLAAAGEADYRLVYTRAPRGGEPTGAARVVRVRPGELTLARFEDDVDAGERRA